MEEQHVRAIYETLAKIFSIRENCEVSVKAVKQKEK